MKKLICLLLSLVMLVNPARAFVPPAVPPIASTTAAVATTIGFGPSIAVAAVGVGMFVAWYGYTHAGSGSIYDQAVSFIDSFTGSRRNPNNSLWDDPAPGARDVSPKSSVPTQPGSVGPNTSQGEFQGAGMDAWFAWVMGGTALADGGYVRSYLKNGVLESQAWLPRVSPAGGVYPANVEYGGVTWVNFDSYRPRYITSGVFNVSANTCPSGYTLSNGSCSLTDATKTKKEGVPCEVLRIPGGFQIDARNPACAGVSVAGARVQVGTDTWTQAPDQSVTWRGFDSQGREREVRLGPPVDNGSRPVETVDGDSTPGSTGQGSSSGASPTAPTGSTPQTPNMNVSGDVVWSPSGQKGSFTSKQQEIDDLRAQVASKISAVRQESKALFDAQMDGSAHAPVYKFTVLGRQYELDLNKYSSSLALIGTGVVFVSLVLAVFIILG